MAYPSLIQKLIRLRQENDRLCSAVSELSGEAVRMSARITQLELGSPTPENSVLLNSILERLVKLESASGHMAPEGYAHESGLRVAPVTLIGEGQEHYSGAALSIVIDNANKD